MAGRRTFTTAVALTIALGGALLAVPTAQAAPAGKAALVYEKGELWFKGAPGQANRLTVTGKVVPGESDWEAYYALTFDDRYDITLAAGDACSYPREYDHTIAECNVLIPMGSDDSDIYDVNLGDGNDTATIASSLSAYASIYGGSGNDVLLGSNSVVLYGENGNDRTDGGGGVWWVGAFGGRGHDTMTNCVSQCRGGAGNDSLTGGPSSEDDDSNALFGDSGNDVLRGKAGADLLRGGKGNDRIYGDQGDDRLYGEDGNDRLYGNSGNDTLYGGRGKDFLSGGPGRNKLYQD
ncbi:calcium-binding protein [Streptomyces tailanensis]|uniref:calcium-binding protein n=1 Tax=Streptomyces tailanensis TaxID=2569858 RepID=UPI00122E0FC8|nr:calcium-binding protein [Streptomyces tailanensis]